MSYTGLAGPTSYGDFVKGVNNRIAEANKYKNFIANFRSNLGKNLSGGNFSTTGFTPVMGPENAPTSTSAPPDDDIFSLVNVSKDPSGRFDNINRSLLDKVANFKPNYSQVRSATSGALDKLSGAQADVDANRADTNSLIAKFNALSPTLDAQVNQQTSALDRVYSGGLKDEFAANTEAARNAERRAADLATRQALFQNRLGGAGGAGSSYARAQLADATGRIGVETAARDADRRRQDTAALLAAQERNLGRTQDLATTNLMRQNIPIDARSRVLDQEVNLALKRLGAAGQAASIDQLTDELSTVGRQLGLTGQALQNYLATNFFGINKQGDDYPLYITGGVGGSRPQSYFPNQGDYGDGGGSGGDYRNPNLPPPVPDWVNRLRAQQGWKRDAQGNYTIPNSDLGGMRPGLGSYNLSNDFDSYGDQYIDGKPNPVYYPEYNNQSRVDRLNMEDYYQGNISDQDLMDFYSGEYNW